MTALVSHIFPLCLSSPSSKNFAPLTSPASRLLLGLWVLYLIYVQHTLALSLASSSAVVVTLIFACIVVLIEVGLASVLVEASILWDHAALRSKST